MIAEINESENGFIIEFKPETPKEVNQLVRLSRGSRKQTTTIETTFYKDGTITGWIQTKLFKRKEFGTVK